MEPDATIRRNPRVVFRELADSTGVLLHLETTAYHGLNQVGVVIWRSLEGGVTFDTLIEKLASEFQGQAPSLEQDVETFLTQLADRDLVWIEGPTSRASVSSGGVAGHRE
jgi:Coenzyme PQQ synthesis protein D (PqqD)